MEIDFTLRQIINKVKALIKEQYDYDLTDEQFIDCVNSQAKGIRFVMENKMIAKVDYIGKFLIRTGREETVEAYKAAKELGLKGEDKVKFINERKAEWKESMKKLEEEEQLEIEERNRLAKPTNGFEIIHTVSTSSLVKPKGFIDYSKL